MNKNSCLYIGIIVMLIFSPLIYLSPHDNTRVGSSSLLDNSLSNVVQPPKTDVMETVGPLWSSNSFGIPVVTVAGTQKNVQTIADGCGGAILTWLDDRDGIHSIYSQRITSAGDPLWALNGSFVHTTNTTDQGEITTVKTCADGTSGVFIFWIEKDPLNGWDSLYISYLAANGTVLWQNVIANSNVIEFDICSDKVGGVIGVFAVSSMITAHETGIGFSVQRWNSSTHIWRNPVELANQYMAGFPSSRNVSVCTDRSNNIYAAWTNLDGDLYAQKLNLNGDMLWSTGGTLVSSYYSSSPSICSDLENGVFVAWYDHRNTSDTIFGQRLNSTGYPMWKSNGVLICNRAGDQRAPQAHHDGTGFFVQWINRDTHKIYVQKLNVSGNALWGTNGTRLNDYESDQLTPNYVPDIQGRPLITWSDNREGDFNIYVQQYTATGDKSFSVNQTIVCNLTGNQVAPSMCINKLGEAIIAWHDNSIAGGSDIYVHKISFEQAVVHKKNLRWRTLHPAVCYDFNSVEVFHNCYETLYWYEGEDVSHVIPWLAADYPTISTDGLNYTIPLRQGVTFHDGTPFNATAVVESVKHIMWLHSTSGSGFYVWELLRGGSEAYTQMTNSSLTQAQQIAAYEAWVASGAIRTGSSPYEVIIELEQPRSDFLHILASWVYSIISPAALAEHQPVFGSMETTWFNDHCVGTGPYQVTEVVSLPLLGRIKLERYDNYWGTPKSTGSAVFSDIVLVYDYSATERTDIQHGFTDIATWSDVEVSKVKELYSSFIEKGLHVSSHTLLRGYELHMNQREIIDGSSNPFYYVEVRQAMNHLFNGTEYLMTVLKGNTERESLVFHGMFGYQPDLEHQYGYDYNETRALELIIAAGFSSSNPLILNISYNIDNQFRYDTAYYFKEKLEALASWITVYVDELTWMDYFNAMINGKLMCYSSGWFMDYADPNHVFSNYILSDSMYGAWDGFNNVTLENLVLQAQVEHNMTLRDQLYRQIEINLLKQAYYVYLGESQTMLALTADLQGECFNPISGVQYYYLNLVVDTTAPIITGNLTKSFYEGTTGNELNFIVQDVYPANYSLYRNDIYWLGDVWSNGTLSFTIDGLTIGTYNYTLIVEDAYGNQATFTTVVTVLEPVEVDTLPPELTGSATLDYVKGTTGNVLAFTVYDPHPANYSLYRDELYVLGDVWSNGTLSFTIDGLTIGTYNYILIVEDAYANQATFTTVVTVLEPVEVDTLPPELTGSATLDYVEGTTGNVLAFTVYDPHPANYSLYRDDNYLMGGSWTNGTLSFNIDGLTSGYYNFTLVVCDFYANQDAVTTIVIVKQSTSSSTSSTTSSSAESSSSDVMFSPGFSIIFPIVVVGFIVITRRKQKHSKKDN